MLVGDYMTTWLRTWCGNLRPTTVAGYRDINRLYITPLLGDLELEAVTPEDIQTAVSLVAEQHGRTAELLLDVLRAALKRAVLTRRIPWNPADACFAPKFARRRVNALTREEEAVFVSAASQVPMWPAIALMLYAGLRRGEVIALRWGDVDLRAGMLSITRSAVQISGALHVGPPKSDAGVRCVPVSPELADVLRKHRRAAMRAGRAGAACPVVASPSGGMVTPAGIYSALRRLEEVTGVHAHPHRLRHTYCTDAAEQGVPVKSLQYAMGHSSSSLTLDTYTTLRYNSIRADFARCGLAL